MEKTEERKLSPWEEGFVKFTEASPEGKHMLEKVAKSLNTKIAYSIGCKHFSEFLKKGLTEIVNKYRTDVKENMYEAFDKWEQIFDDFAIYLKKQGYKSASVTLFHCGAKALINANVPRSLKLKAKSPEVISRTIPPVSIGDLKEIYGMCDPREKAIIAVLKDSGMSASDVVPLNIKDLEGFNKGESWIHMEVFREKENVEYETFLGPDAVTALKAYFTLRERRGETLTPESALFVSNLKPYPRLNTNSLATIFRRIKEKTGKTISTHRLRKFFETYMALVVRHPIILKYWMGHKIKKSRDIESRYIIPPTPEQLKLYKEAYKNIDLTGTSMEERLKELERFKKSLSPEQLAEAERLRILATRKVIKAAKATRKVRVKAAKIKKEEEDYEDDPTFKQISEEALLKHLKAGWQVAYKLENGKVIVKR